MRGPVAGLLLGLLLASLWVATVLRWVDLSGPWTLVAAQAVRWVVAILAVGVLALCVGGRQRAVGAAAALLVLVHAAIAVPSFVPGPGTAPSEDDLVVMAANVELGQADLGALVVAVRAQEVDVLVLLELTQEAADRLGAAGLDDLLPEQELQPAPGPAGSGVLSRYPLDLQEVAPSRFAQPAVEVATPQGPVLIRAAHPTPPVRFPALWHRELGDLAGWAVGSREQDLPLVLAGDLNAGSDHPPFRRLTEVLTDAHAERGQGWVRTWPQGGVVPPFVQLDHVLVRGLPVVDAGTVVLPDTDHAAVWARLGAPGG